MFALVPIDMLLELNVISLLFELSAPFTYILPEVVKESGRDDDRV